MESRFGGEHPSVFRGQGLEFSDVRGYQVGDDASAVDWKVTARRDAPFVRRFVEERDLLLVLVIDVSASGVYGPGQRTPLDVAVELAAALVFSATRRNDRISLVLVSDRIEHVTPPGSGRRHAVRLLADLVAHPVDRRRTDLAPALEWLVRSVGERATVFLLSDLIQAEDESGLRRALARSARRHDLVVLRPGGGPADELPDVGWVEVTDPESGRPAVIDTGRPAVREQYRQVVRRDRRKMANLLEDVGARLVDVDVSGDPLAALANFLRRRRRPR